MIISGDTFYAKHGFIPVDNKDKQKYNQIKKKINSLKIKNVKFEKYLDKYYKINKKIITKESIERIKSFIKSNEDMKMGNFFNILSGKEIFNENCSIVDYLLKKIYNHYDYDSLYGMKYELVL